MTLFDYLDAFLTAYFDDVPLADLADLPPAGLGPAEAPTPLLLDHAGIEAVFGGLNPVAVAMETDGPDPIGAVAGGPSAESGGSPGSPADTWLSGHEWSGEAEVGGDSLTDGTWDTSGEGNHVISVDGEVLDLP